MEDAEGNGEGYEHQQEHGYEAPEMACHGTASFQKVVAKQSAVDDNTVVYQQNAPKREGVPAEIPIDESFDDEHVVL